MKDLLLKSEIGNSRRALFVVGALSAAFIGYKVLEQSGESSVMGWCMAGSAWLFALLVLTAPIWLAEIFIYKDRIVVKKIGGLFYKTVMRADITSFDVKHTPKVRFLRLYNGDERIFTLSSENYANFWEMQDLLLKGVPGTSRSEEANYGYGIGGQNVKMPSTEDAHTPADVMSAHIKLPLIAELPHDHILNKYIEGANQDAQIDGGYAATLVAAYTRYLNERPGIEGGDEWLRKVQRLVRGIPVQQGIANSIYVDLIGFEGI